MFYEETKEKFISDPGYVADYIIAASSELPCPSCLTGLMQDVGEWWVEANDLTEYGEWDSFQCGSCQKRVLIEKENTRARDKGKRS